jgi:type I restriction enzyme S subunit
VRQLRLKDLGRWYSGGTPPKDDEASWDGDLPWLSAKDIASTELREATAFITEEAGRRHSRVAPPGSLLVIVRGMALAHGVPVVRLTSRAAFN